MVYEKTFKIRKLGEENNIFIQYLNNYNSKIDFDSLGKLNFITRLNINQKINFYSAFRNLIHIPSYNDIYLYDAGTMKEINAIFIESINSVFKANEFEKKLKKSFVYQQIVYITGL